LPEARCLTGLRDQSQTSRISDSAIFICEDADIHSGDPGPIPIMFTFGINTLLYKITFILTFRIDISKDVTYSRCYNAKHNNVYKELNKPVLGDKMSQRFLLSRRDYGRKD
jgi:hypothetical protein